jgi:hypothetical protein
LSVGDTLDRKKVELAAAEVLSEWTTLGVKGDVSPRAVKFPVG